MWRTFLAGLALISLAACGGGAKEPPAVAQFSPPTVKPYVAPPKAKARIAKPKAKKAAAPARRPTRKAAAPEDTATPRNPLLNH